MKKRILLLLPAIVFTSCGMFLEDSDYDSFNCPENVEVEDNNSNYPCDFEKLVLSMENKSDITYCYSDEKYLEINKGGKWKKVPYAKQGFLAMSYIMTSGNSGTVIIRSEDYKFDFIEGEYRCIVPVDETEVKSEDLKESMKEDKEVVFYFTLR